MAVAAQKHKLWQTQGVADLTAVREALAAQLTSQIGLRSQAQALDQITPPVAVILPGVPFVQYATTLDHTVTINLRILVLVSAASTPDSQRALDAYLASEGPQSIYQAILADETLGGVTEYAGAMTVATYGLVEYAGINYFGARVDVQIGAE